MLGGETPPFNYRQQVLKSTMCCYQDKPHQPTCNHFLLAGPQQIPGYQSAQDGIVRMEQLPCSSRGDLVSSVYEWKGPVGGPTKSGTGCNRSVAEQQKQHNVDITHRTTALHTHPKLLVNHYQVLTKALTIKSLVVGTTTLTQSPSGDNAISTALHWQERAPRQPPPQM